MNKMIAWFPAIALLVFVSSNTHATKAEACSCKDQPVKAASTSMNKKDAPVIRTAPQRVSHNSINWRALKLTQQQKDQIKEIRLKHHAEIKPQVEKMRALRANIHSLARSEKMDSARLDTLVNQQKEIAAAIFKSKAMVRNEIFQVLNRQQRARFSAM